jgi:hypothetical protein
VPHPAQVLPWYVTNSTGPICFISIQKKNQKLLLKPYPFTVHLKDIFDTDTEIEIVVPPPKESEHSSTTGSSCSTVISSRSSRTRRQRTWAATAFMQVKIIIAFPSSVCLSVVLLVFVGLNSTCMMPCAVDGIETQVVRYEHPHSARDSESETNASSFCLYGDQESGGREEATSKFALIVVRYRRLNLVALRPHSQLCTVNVSFPLFIILEIEFCSFLIQHPDILRIEDFAETKAQTNLVGAR